MSDRAAIVAAARARLGTPWRHQGRGPAGLDCVGLVIVVARDCALVAPDFDVEAYPRRPNGQLSLQLRRYCTPLPRRALRAGAVLCYGARSLPWHVGIVADPARRVIVHACVNRGAVVETSLDLARQLLLMPFDMPGVADG